jgi:hypothetical protein
VTGDCQPLRRPRWWASPCLAIAAVLGVWVYTEERDTLLGQIVSEMTHIAQIEIEDIAEAQTSLQ